MKINGIYINLQLGNLPSYAIKGDRSQRGWPTCSVSLKNGRTRRNPKIYDYTALRIPFVKEPDFRICFIEICISILYTTRLQKKMKIRLAYFAVATTIVRIKIIFKMWIKKIIVVDNCSQKRISIGGRFREIIVNLFPWPKIYLLHWTNNFLNWISFPAISSVLIAVFIKSITFPVNHAW